MHNKKRGTSAQQEEEREQEGWYTTEKRECVETRWPIEGLLEDDLHEVRPKVGGAGARRLADEHNRGADHGFLRLLCVNKPQKYSDKVLTVSLAKRCSKSGMSIGPRMGRRT